MATEQEIIIKYKADVKRLKKDVKVLDKELKKVQGSANKSASSMKKLNTSGKTTAATFKNIAASVGLAFAGTKVISFLKDSIRLYDEQAKKEQALLVALKGRKDVQQSLIKQARQLQKTTLYGDEETIKAQALIAAMVKEEAAIKRVIPLVQDFATAKGVDLAGAADLVSKTLGSSTNALSRYGIEVKGAVGSQERLISLTKGLNDAFGGQAVAAAKVGTGAITQLGNVFSDEMEKIGGAVAEGINWLLRLNDAHLTTADAIDKERIELSTLVLKITELNIPQAERFKLIEKLNFQYPDYFKNLNIEKVTNEQIRDRLKEVNEQLINKILIQRREDKVQEQAVKAADAQEKAIANRNKLDKLSVEANELLKKKIDFTNLSISERIKLLRDALEPQANWTINQKTGTAIKNDELTAQINLVEAWENYAGSLSEASLESAKTSKLTQEKIDLMKELGIAVDDITNKTIEPIIPIVPTDAKDAITALNEEINLLSTSLINQAIAGDIDRGTLIKLRDVQKELLDAQKEVEDGLASLLPKEEDFTQAQKDAVTQILNKRKELENLSLSHLESSVTLDIATDAQERAAEADTRRQERLEKIARTMQLINDVAIIGNDLLAATSTAFGLLSKDQEKLADFQKTIALFQIALDTAQAIAGVVRMATQSGDFVSFAIKLAAGIATVLTNIAKAKALITDTPKAPQFGEGGEIDFGQIHKYGGVPIVAERGEYVVQRTMYTKYKDAVKAINTDSYDDYITRNIERPLIAAIEAKKKAEMEDFATNIAHSMNVEMSGNMEHWLMKIARKKDMSINNFGDLAKQLKGSKIDRTKY